MTVDTYDNLSTFIGKHMTNAMWKNLIADEFKVSNSVANEMLHAMYVAKRIHDLNDSYDRERGKY